MIEIRRGAVCLADLQPRRGTEPGKVRPVLIVQTDLLNGRHPSTVVCPLTTKVTPSAVRLRVHLAAGEAGLERASDVMIDQLRAIDNRRLIKALGRAPEALMRKVSENVALVLGLVLRS